jgi:phage head maturation protease
LSIGYRTVKAERDGKGQRLLSELELWEVSLVTFPMLPEARVSAKGDTPDADIWRELAAIFDDAALSLAGR